MDSIDRTTVGVRTRREIGRYKPPAIAVFTAFLATFLSYHKNYNLHQIKFFKKIFEKRLTFFFFVYNNINKIRNTHVKQKFLVTNALGIKKPQPHK